MHKRRTAFASGAVALAITLMFTSCGGGGGSTGNERDSGADKTTLSVQAADPDGDTLRYEWRVTAGTVENRNAAQTVWTLPRGPGLHFAYVIVSDGRGGYAQKQYAVGSDALEEPALARPPVAYAAPASGLIADEGIVRRLRFVAPGSLTFTDSGNTGTRTVYVPDVAVTVSDAASAVVFSGTTDAAGEVNLPKLPAGSYAISCSTAQGAPLKACGSLNIGTSSSVATPSVALDAGSNLRVFGHVSLADGVCGLRDEFFGLSDAATVQLQTTEGQTIGSPKRVNRFGDYFIDAAVVNDKPLKLRIQCGADVHLADVLPNAGGFLAMPPVQLNHRSANRRPEITRVVANGPEGSVRGREVVAEAGALSNTLPGSYRFLSYKGTDTARSACMYYRSIGAVSACDAQGRMQNAIAFDDWKKHHGFEPFASGDPEVAATYINQRDLNLVRRMFAKRVSDTQVAFYVCNNPGPEKRPQAAVEEVVDFGLANERRVACVAMEWSTTPGVNGGRPFTKFLTFGPDGALIPAVDLDGRGQKFMPGACIACHGGSQIGGRFPETGDPSPFLGSRFLPFDTGNFLFSTRSGLTEADQQAALKALNDLVVRTEGGADTATTRLVRGWYADGSGRLNKDFVPVDPDPAIPGWHESPEKAAFYRQVIGTSCRTCHAALGSADPRFDWDLRHDRFTGSISSPVFPHVCGGTADLATNASMPNALASLDRLLDPAAPGIDELKRLMQKYIGCSAPAPDPVFTRR
jgi:hypothetical protein